MFHCRAFIIVYTLHILCFWPIRKADDCVRIEQADKAYRYEPTTLGCIEGSNAGDDVILLTWLFNSRGSAEKILVQYFKSTGNLVITDEYKWKVSSSWDNSAKTFALTIKNTTIEDDSTKTLWKCTILSSSCTMISATHRIEVRGM